MSECIFWGLRLDTVDALDSSVARVLYSGSAILRGLPAWGGCAHFKNGNVPV